MFGAVHDFLKGVFGKSIVTSYSFLLPCIFGGVILLFFFLKHTRSRFIAINQYISVLLWIFLILEIAVFSYKGLTKEARFNYLASEKVLENKKITGDKPDIFFIVLDEYTSSKCLKEEFNYDNKEIDSLLNASRFYTSYLSKSNYNATPYSLASTFNMQYLRYGLEEHIINSKFFLQAIHTFEQNELINFLRKQGYTIKNYGCLKLEGVSMDTNPYFYKLDYDQIDSRTLYSRIQRDISYNWQSKNIFTGEFKIPSKYISSKQYHFFRNDYNYTKLISELSISENTPRFIYAHLILPHEPFYLNEDGSFVSDKQIILKQQDLKEAYLNQLKYCNKLFKKIIRLASDTGFKNRVVIIEGDHGFRDYKDPSKLEREFDNLNCYYFSDHDYRTLYPGISPINSFRVVLNKYFAQSLPMLKDSTIRLENDVLKKQKN